MILKGIGVSVIGPTHIQEGLPNQDSLSLRGHKGGWIASVCDGLGSHEYSDYGSKMASLSVQEVFRYLPTDMALTDFNKHIHKCWNDKIESVLLPRASTTCLYSSVLKNGDVIVGQLGDGMILYKESGRFHQFTPEREVFSNQTIALQSKYCEKDWHNTRCKFTQSGDGIILMTDGISDDLKPDVLPGFFNAIFQLATDTARRKAKIWLHKEFEEWSTPKHGDDKTLAAIFRI